MLNKHDLGITLDTCSSLATLYLGLEWLKNGLMETIKARNAYEAAYGLGKMTSGGLLLFAVYKTDLEGNASSCEIRDNQICNEHVCELGR